MAEYSLRVDVHGYDLIVSCGRKGFIAVYYKPSDQPHLLLRHSTRTDDHQLLAQVWQAANNKARELGWIV